MIQMQLNDVCRKYSRASPFFALLPQLGDVEDIKGQGVGEQADRVVEGIGRAVALLGLAPFKDPGIANINTTYRGQILTDQNETRFAILKDLAARELANEIVISLLGRTLELPIPPAYLALVRTGEAHVVHAPAVEGGHVFFASCDVNSPSVSSIVAKENFSQSSVRSIVEALLKRDFSTVYELDSWCANVDRHLGNLLLAGNGDFWMIDHGRCFTGPDWEAASLSPTALVENRLKRWATPCLTRDEADRLLAAIGKLVARADEIDLRSAGALSGVPELIGSVDFEALINFMGDRKREVPRLSADALGRLM